MLEDTYAAVPANISPLLAFVVNATIEENKAVNNAIKPSFTDILGTRYKITIESTGRRDDNTTLNTLIGR